MLLTLRALLVVVAIGCVSGVDVPSVVAQQSSSVEMGNSPENLEARLLNPQVDSVQLIAGLVVTRREETNTEELQQELERLQQELLLVQENHDRHAEANILNNIGGVYIRLHEYSQSLETYEQALEIYRKLEDYQGEANMLGNIGDAYFKLGQYDQVEELLRRNLEPLRINQNHEHEQILLEVIHQHFDNLWGLSAACGAVRDSQIQQRIMERTISWQEILMISELNLFVLEEAGISGSGCITYPSVLHGMGWAYRNMGQYSQALRLLQQAVTTYKIHGEPTQLSLVDLSTVYTDLGQYDEALRILESALSLGQEENCLCNVFSRLGFVYKELGQYDKALHYLEQALSLFPNDSERQNVLNYLGEVYELTGQYDEALDFYNQALASPPVAGEQSSKGFILNNIGSVYAHTGDVDEALSAYQQGLTLFQRLNDRAGESFTLANMAALFQQQNHSEIAITFYKESVNITEIIRRDIQGLSQEIQQSYTDSVADDYRALADLLLAQGRILEAQQVLDLLKLEELREFTRDARSIGSGDGIALNATEQQILDEYGSIVAFGQKLAECEQTNCPEEDQLRSQQRDLNAAYRDRMETLISTIRDNRRNDDFFNDPRNLGENALAIVNAQPGTVLIYPFVQDDKLWLLWTTTGGVVGSKAIEVTQVELGETVVRFRQLLQDRHSDLGELQATSKQLYDWLIAPLKQELEAQGQPIEHLVFAQDRILRYLPMAALYDGEQYLIERYTVSTILSAELTDMSDRLSPTTADNPLLALGVSDSVDGLDPLPNVSIELDEIVRTASTDSAGIYPGQEYLNENFTLAAIENNLRDSRIVHIATHGAFVPGLPDQSYLVLGDGQKLTIPQIDRLGYDLQNVNLVVLSACETALGGPGSDGIEIAGISSYFLDANRASTVLASLWQVNDASTSALMQQFYANLADGMTKSEALRQAQLDLLNRGSAAASENRTGDGTVVAIDPTTGRPRSIGNPSHPYFWSPFILIGNGL